MSHSAPDDYKWTDAVGKQRSQRPLDSEVAQLVQHWVTGTQSDQQVFEKIESLSEELVPATDGDTFSLECYQRTLQRVKELMALQQTVLFLIEHPRSSQESKTEEFEKMLSIANEQRSNAIPRTDSSWHQHLEGMKSDWMNGKAGCTEVVLKLGMFVDGALCSSLILGMGANETRDSHECSLRDGVTAATLQFAAQKADLDGAISPAERRRVYESLAVANQHSR